MKQFSFQNKTLQVSFDLSLIIESLCASHPNLVHIGIGSSVISSSDMAGSCKYISLRSPSGLPELTLYLRRNIEIESLNLLISTVAFSKILNSFGYRIAGNFRGTKYSWFINIETFRG